MRLRLLGLVRLGLGLWTGAAFAMDSGAVQRVGECAGCHMRNADGVVPRINGQIPHYIVRRLDQLSQVESTRVAHHVPTPFKRQIADYFARLPPPPAHASPSSVLGAEIYRRGIPAKNIAACQYCHGAGGEGSGAVPRIAGQRPAYLRQRLDMLSGFTLSGSGAMHMAIENVTPTEIDAITAYLASQ